MFAPHLATTWDDVRRELRAAVTDAVWHLWLESLTVRAHHADVLVLEAPERSRGWVSERYGRLLDRCAQATLGPGTTVQVVGADEEGPAAAAAAPAGPSGALAGLDPRLTFEQFVIGEANQLAHAAALAVAETPGHAYNPLFICGAPGLGKTHLLHCIGNYVRANAEGHSVRYTTVEQFTNHFVGALQGGGGLDAFKAAHRDVDVLLVDDVQFLQTKARTEQEFFHTFNALLGSGAQVVLTSDRPPADLEDLEDRLRERFGAGLVADVARPDFATRLTILRKRALLDDLEVDADALALIAERVDSHVRALEGALIRVVALGSLTGRRVTRALADEVLTGLSPGVRPRPVTLEAIQAATAAACGVPVEGLVSPSRAAGLAWPRQAAMYLARELTQESLPAIGRAFGGRSHTTVLHAHRRATARLQRDPEARALLHELTRELTRG